MSILLLHRNMVRRLIGEGHKSRGLYTSLELVHLSLVLDPHLLNVYMNAWVIFTCQN